MPLLKKEILQLITSVKGIETIILYLHSAKPSKSQIKVNKHVGKLQGALFFTDFDTARLPVDMPILVSICKVNKYTH